jgi:hypothetical protein
LVLDIKSADKLVTTVDMYMIRSVIAGIGLKNITTTLFSTHFLDEYHPWYTQTRRPAAKPRGRRLSLSLGLRRSDVFFGYFPIRPGTAQVKKLQLEKSNHLHFWGETTALKHSLMAMVAFLVFIVVTPIGIQLAFMGIGGMRDN